jgi:putative tricarboxylic transport membrane protein
VATTFDGYPMAQQGRAGEALTGRLHLLLRRALVAVVLITFVAPLVARLRAPVRAARVLRGDVPVLRELHRPVAGSPLKTLAAMMLGFLLAAVGMDTVTGQLRLTFGSTR